MMISVRHPSLVFIAVAAALLSGCFKPGLLDVDAVNETMAIAEADVRMIADHLDLFFAEEDVVVERPEELNPDRGVDFDMPGRVEIWGTLPVETKLSGLVLAMEGDRVRTDRDEL